MMWTVGTMAPCSWPQIDEQRLRLRSTLVGIPIGDYKQARKEPNYSILGKRSPTALTGGGRQSGDRRMTIVIKDAKGYVDPTGQMGSVLETPGYLPRHVNRQWHR